MGGALAKRQGGGGAGAAPTPAPPNRGRRGLQLRQGTSISEFNIVDMATSFTQRFSVMSGLSFISMVAVPTNEVNRRPRCRVSRKRWRPSTLENEYAGCKTVWPVAQTEVLFLPEFPVGIDEKLKLIFLGEISRGAFGQVFHVKCASTNKEFAMKVLSKSQVCSLDAVSQVKQEVMIQQACSHHPFITPLAHFWQTRKLLIVMTEYIGYGELQQLWHSLGKLPENLLSLYIAEIALALDFLHNAGIIYRDLKMENILLDADGHIKLIDFGLARWLSYGGRTSTICGTLQFMAPEVLRGEAYTHSVDWWSLGIISYSLLVGHYPISGYHDHYSMNSAVTKFMYRPPPDCGASLAMKEVICSLLLRDATARLHSLLMLQREELYRRTNFDDIRERKIAPRKVLEEHIERKTRKNFVEFGGLTSTPKRASPGIVESGYFGCRRHRPSTNFQTSSSSMLCPPGKEGVWHGHARRSASSPLLHPGRLGHHDALVKSVSACGYNGAAVPLLQSPLLRLARGQDGPPPRRVRSQGAVSAGALPTAVSPLLVNVRGNRQSKWITNDNVNAHIINASKNTNSPVAPVKKVAVSGMNGVYKKCVSEEVLGAKSKMRDPQLLPRSHTSDITNNPKPASLTPSTGTSQCSGASQSSSCSEAVINNRQLQSCVNPSNEQQCSSVPQPSTRDKPMSSAIDQCMPLVVDAPTSLYTDCSSQGNNAPGSCHKQNYVSPNKSNHECCPKDNTTPGLCGVQDLVSPTTCSSVASSASCPPVDYHCAAPDFIEHCGNLQEDFFCDLVTSTPKKTSLNNSCGNIRNYQMTLNSDMQVSGKCHLINGALLTNNNNFSPLEEKDFHDSFDKFPWISESLDT